MKPVYRFAVAPRWLALHVLLVATVGGFVTLGWWQWQSYRAHTRPAPAAADAAPVPLAQVHALGRRVAAGTAVQVSATGRYDVAGQVVVPGREHAGRRGVLVVTPLLLPDGVLPVVRGWREHPDAAAAVPSGEVTVTGTLQANEPDVGPRGVGSTPAGPEISAVSTAELLRRLPYPPQRLYDGHLVLAQQDPPPAADAPVLVPPREHRGGVSAWRNVSYALQWWLFAAAAVWLWGSFLRSAARGRSAGSDADPLVAHDPPLSNERGERHGAGEGDQHGLPRRPA